MFEGGAQAALSLVGSSDIAYQEVEVPGELPCDLEARHEPHPGGGQLETQRCPANETADVEHVREGVVEGEIRPNSLGALDEEPYRVAGLRQLERRVPVAGVAEAIQGQQPL